MQYSGTRLYKIDKNLTSIMPPKIVSVFSILLESVWAGVGENTVNTPTSRKRVTFFVTKTSMLVSTEIFVENQHGIIK